MICLSRDVPVLRRGRIQPAPNLATETDKKCSHCSKRLLCLGNYAFGNAPIPEWGVPLGEKAALPLGYQAWLSSLAGTSVLGSRDSEM